MRERNSLTRLKNLLLQPRVDEHLLQDALEQARQQQPVPVLWLVGKTQSGKSSLIRTLTGSADAEIGNGFRPCTRTARFYDFPAEFPVVRFLDTRGLGEIAYDPAEDIRYCEQQAHLVVAVMRVTDPGQQAVIDVLRAVRKRHPGWPVVIVQTCLHQCHGPDWQHPQPWPYHPLDALPADDLVRALKSQRDRLGSLPGHGGLWWVAVDFTLPEDGFADPAYGLEALWNAIEDASTFGLRALLESDPALQDAYGRAASSHILGYTLAAAGVGALPVVDLAAVPAIQVKLFHTLAFLYDMPWDLRTTSEFFSLLGAGIGLGYGLRYAGRNLVKLVPVWGQTLGALWGASSSAAMTFALGKAACFYLERKHRGLPVEHEQLRKVFGEALHKGRELASHHLTRSNPHEP